MIWGDRIGILCTSSLVFDFRRNKVLGPRALLALQGYNAGLVDLAGKDFNDVRNIVGEAIFLPSLARILAIIACCSRMPWVS